MSASISDFRLYAELFTTETMGNMSTFWNATASMQPGHSVEPGRKQLSRVAISL